MCTQSTLDIWNQLSSKFLIYSRLDKQISPDWPTNCVEVNKDENVNFIHLGQIIEAFAELPQLILKVQHIHCSNVVVEKLSQMYLGVSEWLRHEWININSITGGTAKPKDIFWSRALVSIRLLELIQDLYSNTSPFCNWARAYSLPLEIWFLAEYEYCYIDLQDKNILPGGKELQGKVQSCKSNIAAANLLHYPEQYSLNIQWEKDSENITPLLAIALTADKLARENPDYAKIGSQALYYANIARHRSPYEKFLIATRKQNNEVMKSKQAVNTYSPDGGITLEAVETLLKKQKRQRTHKQA